MNNINCSQDFSFETCAICGKKTVETNNGYEQYFQCQDTDWHRYFIDAKSDSVNVGLYFMIGQADYCFEYRGGQDTILWQRLSPDRKWDTIIKNLPFILPEHINSLEKVQRKIQTLLSFI